MKITIKLSVLFKSGVILDMGEVEGTKGEFEGVLRVLSEGDGVLQWGKNIFFVRSVECVTWEQVGE